MDTTPTKHVCAAHKDRIYCFSAIEDKNKNTIYSDHTGKLLVRSYNGMVYSCVAYVYTFNTIFLRPTKSREDASMMEAFTSICADLEAIGYTPKLHILDNVCFCTVHTFPKIKNTTRQNMEVHHHNVNAAEPAVKSAKDHILSHVATMDAFCPIHLWSNIISQMQDTLNMLRTLRNNNNPLRTRK